MRPLLPLVFALSCANAPELAPLDAPTYEAARVRPSVPVQGGTLAEADAHLLVFADPTMDVVDIVGRHPLRHVGSATFEGGAQPSRVTTVDRTAFVVLRGAGSVVAIDMESAAQTWRQWVCPEPRGIDASDEEVVVACASGELVTLSPEGDVRHTAFVDTDLRDVVLDGKIRYVSRFRSAQVLDVQMDGTVSRRRAPPVYVADVHTFTRTEQFSPGVAWRMVADPDGGVLLLHQRASDHPLEDRPGTRPEDFANVPTFLDRVEVPTVQEYYGPPANPRGWIEVEVEVGPDCRSPVTHAAITRFTSEGEPLTSVPIVTGPLTVDLSVEGDTYLLASASKQFDQISSIDETHLFHSPWGCVNTGFRVGEGMMTSVSGASGDFVFGRLYPRSVTTQEGELVLDQTRAPVGYELFHTDPGSKMACASCHPEGMDDGHTWLTHEDGARRTLRVGGGLASAAPYHWEGNHRTLDHVLQETYERRMGGQPVAPEDAGALLAFLDRIAVPSASAQDLELVERGRHLFDERDCSTCHSGSNRTNGAIADIGKSELSKTPSLRGVGLRSPLMRDGCADTLEERFTNPHCGGLDHGSVAADETEVIGALVAFMETL